MLCSTEIDDCSLDIRCRCQMHAQYLDAQRSRVTAAVPLVSSWPKRVLAKSTIPAQPARRDRYRQMSKVPTPSHDSSSSNRDQQAAEPKTATEQFHHTVSVARAQAAAAAGAAASTSTNTPQCVDEAVAEDYGEANFDFSQSDSPSTSEKASSESDSSSS